MLGHPERGTRPGSGNASNLPEELGFVQLIAQSLDSAAAVLVDGGDARTALLLVGAADVMYEDLNLSEADSERRVGDRAVDVSVRLLGPDVARDVREEGRKLDTEQAIELVLASIG